MTAGTRTVLGVTIALAMVSADALGSDKEAVVYDDFAKPGYSAADYEERWTNVYGPLTLAASGTRSFDGGRITVRSAPFDVGADFSVYDHLKYMAISNRSWDVPEHGSLTFASTITATVSRTQPEGRVVRGTYRLGGEPYVATASEVQQAGVVMNMIDFCTGQLFDWFVSGTTAAPLIERLPSNITGNTSNPACPDATHVGRDLMYTQLIEEVPITPGPHRVAITYTRNPSGATVEYFLDGARVAKVKDVGIPLDVQGVPYTGTYPALGPGALVDGGIRSFTLAHGLFSLLDAFPFQHPEAPELDVTIPLSERLFGQGAEGAWDDFVVTTVRHGR